MKNDGREMVRAMHKVEAESRRRIERQVRRLTPAEIAELCLDPPVGCEPYPWVEGR